MSAKTQLERLQKAMENGMRPEEKRELRERERRIKLLEGYESFGKLPAIQDFTAWAKGQIQSGAERLSTDRTLAKDGHEGQRLAIMERSEVLLHLIGLFDPSAELEEIEKELSFRAEQFEKYNGTE